MARRSSVNVGEDDFMIVAQAAMEAQERGDDDAARALDKLAQSCLNCGLAEWQRTKNDRLHPSGNGRCKWRMPKIPLPRSFYFIGPQHHSDLVPFTGTGGYLERKRPHHDCPCWEPLKS